MSNLKTDANIKLRYFYIWFLLKTKKLVNLKKDQYRAWGKTTLIMNQACKYNLPIVVEHYSTKDIIEKRARELMAKGKIKRLPTIWCVNDNMRGYGESTVFVDLTPKGLATLRNNTSFKIAGGFVQS